jgi:cytidine deaminase
MNLTKINKMDKEFKFNYKLIDSVELLYNDDILLVEKAISGMDNAYAPYSNFKVGASIRLENGEIVVGNNQENIAYPSGLCAERVALFYVGANYPNVSIETICIVAKGDLIPIDSIIAPCGSCRQVMIESEQRQPKPIRVILVNQNKTVVIVESVKYFLPFIFG